MTTNEAIAHFSNLRFGISSEYLYCYLLSFDYNSLGSTSSIATAVNSKIIKKIPVLVPNEIILKKFYLLAEDLFKKMNLLSLEDDQLTQLRDTLLPKLISGELSLTDIDLENS